MTIMDNTLDRYGRDLHSKTELNPGTALPPLPPMGSPLESFAIGICRDCPEHSEWEMGQGEPEMVYDWQFNHRTIAGHERTLLFHITRGNLLKGVVDRSMEGAGT